MTKVFLYLANRSIRAGFLILAVIGLRFLFRKLPKGPQLQHVLRNRCIGCHHFGCRQQSNPLFPERWQFD